MKTITLTAPAKLTKDCFVGEQWYYRDSDFVTLLPKKQPKQSGEITVIVRDKDQTFLEMVQEYLGTQDPEKIKPHCLTLPMVEKMIEEHSDLLRTDGRANFFFVENKDGNVSVARVDRDGPGWYAYVYRLDDGGRWYAVDRLLVRNLDTKSLSPSVPVSDLEARVAELERIIKYHNL